VKLEDTEKIIRSVYGPGSCISGPVLVTVIGRIRRIKKCILYVDTLGVDTVWKWAVLLAFDRNPQS
jgi:hypothetical protein